MKLTLSEGERYPAWFIRTRDECAFGNPPSEADLEDFDRCAVEVPDELAARWIAARDAWDAAEEEISAWHEARGSVPL